MKRYLILLPILLAAGCVTPAKFKEKEAQAAAYKERLQAAETQLAETRKQLEAAKATAAAVQATAEASQKSESDLSAKLKVSGDHLASAKVQLDSVQKSNKDLQETLDAKKGELTKKVSDLIKEKDELAKKVAEASAALAVRNQELASAREEKAAVEKAKEAELAKTKAEKEAELAQVKRNYEDLTASLKSEISAGEVTITQLKGKLTVNMVDRILFDSGMAEIRPAGKKVLERIGSVLTGVKDKDIRIEGHTDNKPIGGELKNKYATNWELSTARATAVARHLQDQAKVDPLRLVAAGYGEFRPVSSNDTPEKRALNRRIEIVLVPKE